MGRGRPMPNKQNLRVVECKPQPCVVSVEGLSSSTTDAQLKSLLMSVGPIQVGAWLPASVPAPQPTTRCFLLCPPSCGFLPVKVAHRGGRIGVLPACALATSTLAPELDYWEVFRCSVRNLMKSFQPNKLSFEILSYPKVHICTPHQTVFLLSHTCFRCNNLKAFLTLISRSSFPVLTSGTWIRVYK